MIIVNLKGGLGNQMFQYALGYVLAKKKNCDLFCDIRLQEFYKKNPPPRNVPREIDLDIFGINVKQPSNWVLLKVLQNFLGIRQSRLDHRIVIKKISFHQIQLP